MGKYRYMEICISISKFPKIRDLLSRKETHTIVSSEKEDYKTSLQYGAVFIDENIYGRRKDRKMSTKIPSAGFARRRT